MKVLITGGAGFIGSTIASAAIDAGHVPVILDNFVTGRREFVRDRLHYEGDIADEQLVGKIFDDHPDISAVVHCAALIVVPDSVSRPLDYYVANVTKTVDFVKAVEARGLTRFLFSSSASIYGPSETFVVTEQHEVAPSSPYARTKAMVEEILADVSSATDLRVLSLRYFNPIGTDPAMRTGLQLALPSHALGKLILCHRAGEPFPITGTDFPTRDGTGVRDYVHVWDLARAHIAALERFDEALDGQQHLVINLGTGTGTTVSELAAAFEQVTGQPMPTIHVDRRPGDVAGACAANQRAKELLDWDPRLSIEQGIRDSLTWFEKRGSLLPDLI